MEAELKEYNKKRKERRLELMKRREKQKDTTRESGNKKEREYHANCATNKQGPVRANEVRNKQCKGRMVFCTV